MCSALKYNAESFELHSFGQNLLHQLLFNSQIVFQYKSICFQGTLPLFSCQFVLENNFSALEETVRKGKVGVCLALMALPMILNSHNFSVCNS